MAQQHQDRRERTGGDVALEIRDAQVAFETGRGLARILESVDVTVERGEVLGVAGESGSGKSTFASAILNSVADPGVLMGDVIYHPPDGDPVDIADLEPHELRRVQWEEIAMVSQESMNAFNPTLTIRKHFLETLDAHGADQAEGLEKARELLASLDLEPERILDAHQHELSGGEKQRAMLALSLVLDPEVLLLDEPTVGLDVIARKELLTHLGRLKEEFDLTMIFVSHDLSILSAFADRIAVMYAFQFVEIGTFEEVLLSSQHPYTRLLINMALDSSVSAGDLQTIEGETPDPTNVPTGCSFHPRCPLADDRCQVDEPELRSEQGSDHRAACYYPDLAQEEIPVNLEEDDYT